MGDSVQSDTELEAFKILHRYNHCKRIPGGLVVAISPLTFGRARLNVGTLHGILHGY